jgi:hypothetical protein
MHKQSYSCKRPWRPIGSWDVKDPTLSRQSAHRWRLGCQPYAPAALCSPEIFFCFWYSFLLEAEKPEGLVRPEGSDKLKKSNDLIRNRTRDLPAVCQHFMEPECSLPHSQELSTCPYPELDQSRPQHPILPPQDPCLLLLLLLLFTHLRLGFPSGLLPSGCPMMNLY